MELDFAKLHGTGNDFIFIDDFSLDVELSVSQIQFLCDRHFGIGADGVIMVRPSRRNDCAAYMHYINSDGSLAQMCGNGIRCFAKYLVDRGFVNYQDNSFVADTLAGPKTIVFNVGDDNLLTEACVDMGEPVFMPDKIPTTLVANLKHENLGDIVLAQPIDSPWGKFTFTCVSMGNPHAVCFIDNFDILDDVLFSNPQNKDLANFELDKIGAYFESHPLFPERVNVEFAYCEKDCIRMRVYERGCGETLACGTGACATLVAAHLNALSQGKNTLNLRGGKLEIEWKDNNHVYLSGPACEVFSGSIRV